jgi:hypothetical protein
MSDSPAMQPSQSSQSDPAVQASAEGAAGGDQVTELVAITNLAAYIDWQTPQSFTDEARTALLSEVQEYVRQICNLARICQRRDGAEKALKSYVDDSASFLRNKSGNPKKILADWCKWIGFTFFGFTVQQIANVQHQKIIAHGSVLLLVMDVAIAAVLISAGFAIDRPLRNILRWRRDS